MPTKVTAKNGDCLCGIAVDAGFLNCQPLRDQPENAAFLTRDLNDGDEVTVPDLSVEDFPKAIDTKHKFKLKSSPPFNIRFVHGSPTLPYRDDSETTTLHVSNFVTNLGGADGLQLLPTGFGFKDNGHQDPDTFKVEVWDPAAGGSVKVKLEALKPAYTADPLSGKLTATSFTPFTDAGRKFDALDCNVVSATSSNTYRSKYMRLVADEEDLNDSGITDQLLLTSDLADGLGTGGAADNDTVEILDQLVRATYEIKRCTGSPKCKVSKIVDIGGSERLRVRVHFHAFRKDVGVDTMPTGITGTVIQQHLRRRTFKWYRRAYAQAEMAPKLSSMNVIDPPPENMFCLSHSHGLAVAAGAPVTLDFGLRTDTRVLPVSIVFAGGETPVLAGAVILAGLPAGFAGEVFPCPLSTDALNPAADVIITADNGERVTILLPTPSPGAGMTFDVPRVDLMKVISDDAAQDASVQFLTIDFKRLLRAVPVTEDAMHCVVVGRFSTPSLRGMAFSDCHLADPPFLPDLPFHSSTIMAYEAEGGAGGFVGVLDNGDTFPFTSPHESAHTLCDLVHTIAGTKHERNQLLAGGTSEDNRVTATKRLCDGPFLVTLRQIFTTTGANVQVKLAEIIRDRGASKMEAW